MSGTNLGWIKDFSSHRAQLVPLEGHTSSLLDALSGIPQGTVLMPSPGYHREPSWEHSFYGLYLWPTKYTKECSNSDTRLFADDSLVYHQTQKQRDAAKLQKDLTALEALEGWERRWQICFNPEKCTTDITHLGTEESEVYIAIDTAS